MTKSYTIKDCFFDIDNKIRRYIKNSDFIKNALPEFFRKEVLEYILRPGKRLRPSLFLLSHSCVGGEDNEALIMPVAVSLELFHTWTLIHDDLIDNATQRRGNKSLHTQWALDAQRTQCLSENDAKLYGRDAAMLIGDILHGISSALFMESIKNSDLDPTVVVQLFQYLQANIIGHLAQGELLDIQYGLRNSKLFSTLNEEHLLEVARMKSGLLFKFCAIAGASLGTRNFNLDDNYTRALGKFAINFGIAFQLQDDIIGIVKDCDVTGKDFGSDIREGKMTLVVLNALKNANPNQKQKIFSALGNQLISVESLGEVAELMIELGGIKKTEMIIGKYVENALNSLDAIEESVHKNLLKAFAQLTLNSDHCCPK